MPKKKIIVIPDVQVKPNQDYTFLKYVGQYIADKKPDDIVCIGDFADMPSLSIYDVGTKPYEGRTYADDVEATKEAMAMLLAPIREEQARLKRNKEKQWKPRMVLTLGNHENRINRAINTDRKLEKLISTKDLGFEKAGWEVHTFLEVVVIEGIAFSHYFTSGVKGLPISSAQLLLNKQHMSCFAGHQQGRQIAYGKRADGKQMTAIISGSCYLSEEDYLGPQGNSHFRGFWVLHNVTDGSFDEMPVPLSYVIEKYGDK
jgi:hypothetical protein